jgi:hypothetical protein
MMAYICCKFIAAELHSVHLPFIQLLSTIGILCLCKITNFSVVALQTLAFIHQNVEPHIRSTIAYI